MVLECPYAVIVEVVALTVFMALSVLFWGGTVIFAFRMIRGRCDGVPLFPKDVARNPFNLIFAPKLLSKKGLIYRRYLILSIIGLVLSGMVTAAMIYTIQKREDATGGLLRHVSENSPLNPNLNKGNAEGDGVTEGIKRGISPTPELGDPANNE